LGPKKYSIGKKGYGNSRGTGTDGVTKWMCVVNERARHYLLESVNITLLRQVTKEIHQLTCKNIQTPPRQESCITQKVGAGWSIRLAKGQEDPVKNKAIRNRLA
jgi:hypothetical protein